MHTFLAIVGALVGSLAAALATYAFAVFIGDRIVTHREWNFQIQIVGLICAAIVWIAAFVAIGVSSSSGANPDRCGVGTVLVEDYNIATKRIDRVCVVAGRG
jgi:hypothetical protein